jgi:type 2 lantibiotic biosynthesis protein LanM
MPSNVSCSESAPRPLPVGAPAFSEAPRSRVLAGFLEPFSHLIHESRGRLRKGLRALGQSATRAPFDSVAIEDALFSSLQEQLLAMAGRVMVLELNVARLEGFLEGATARERFSSFLQRARLPNNARALSEEYPVLVSQIANRLDQWVESSLEFLRRLCADWVAIRHTLLRDDPGQVVDIASGGSDRHRDGRSVVIARFSSGAQLVYKPRSMAVDVHFQELLLWLNERGRGPMFRTLNILDRKTYGWTEFVSAQTCDSPLEISRFYERQGGYLALLYALEAADFHCENLIAAGEHPMLLDLEGLFHPRLDSVDENSVHYLAGSAICYSALRTGLLPQRFRTADGQEEADLSGLGSVAGQMSPRGAPAWAYAGTDEMRLVRKRVELPALNNRPMLRGSEVNAAEYADAIVSGFESVYGNLRAHRNDLLRFCVRFADDEVRVIARGTQTYAAMLFESFHPDVLRNSADRDLLFGQLRAAVEQSPHLAALIESERADLLRGDIPLFTTRVNSRDLWTSSGERIANYLREPALVSVQERIQRLSDRDLQQQLWIVRASLATLAAVVEEPKPSPYAMARSKSRIGPEEYVATACLAADRLEALALRGNDDIAWIGLTHLNERDWSLAPLATELYDGLPGIVLFFAYLGSLTRKDSYTALAKVALKTLFSQLEHGRATAGIGAFNGLGGIIYALAHLGAIWEDPRLFARAEEFVPRIAELIPTDTRLDIIGGAAGCILALNALYSCSPSEQILEVARRCGEHLLETKQQTPHGIGWLPDGIASRPLTGFSHGNAGIACALMQLTRLTGELRFRSAAVDAVAYERSLFSPEQRNWPDLRSEETRFSIAWCHGAPGIGLARLHSLCGEDDSSILAEIEAATKTTLALGFGFNHSLCHGDLGNVDFLLETGRKLNDRRLLAQAHRIAGGIVGQIGRHRWACGNPLRVESPGLMTGLAGIGYEMLRLAEPARVPSVLSLESRIAP